MRNQPRSPQYVPQEFLPYLKGRRHAAAQQQSRHAAHAPELGAVSSDAPSCEGDDVVHAGLPIVRDDACAVPALQGVGVDAAAHGPTGEDFLNDGIVGADGAELLD